MKSLELYRNGTQFSACFRVINTEQPEPGPGELLIRVSHSGINFADYMAMRGKYEDAPKKPFVPGYEVSGEVVQIGSAELEHWIGKKVLAFTLFGGYSQYVKVNGQHVVEIPEHWDGAVATALATQYVTAWYLAKDLAAVRPGMQVLVPSAAGGVGQALMDMIRLLKGEALGIVSSEKSALFLKQRGHLNVMVVDKGAWWKNGLLMPMDVILDASGGSSYRKGKKWLKLGGKWISYGVSSRLGSFSLYRDLKLIFGFGFISPVSFMIRSQGFIGLNMLVIAKHRPEILQACMHEVVEMLKNRDLPFPHVHCFPVSQSADAYEALVSRDHPGKMVLCWE